MQWNRLRAQPLCEGRALLLHGAAFISCPLPQRSPPCQVGLLASLTLVQTEALTPRTGSHPDRANGKKAFVPGLKL